MTPAPIPLSHGRPIHVAVIGAGPAGFFTADALLRRATPHFEVDVLERLPTPFGLVRAGVAPDHQQIKGVQRTFEQTAQNGRFRFLGGVDVGRHVSVDELGVIYDVVVYATGSAADRRLGIPGEELGGSYAATAFVGWYNAHPDFVDFPFDLDHERIVVVGVGNVAIDVARLLLRDRDELARTDIAAHALAALRRSRVREVVLLARRGPAQAAFHAREIEAVAALGDVRVAFDPAPVEAELARLGELAPPARRVVEALASIAQATPRDAPRTLRIEFLASPTELLGDEHGRVRAVRVERNELVRGAGGDVRARGTGRTSEIETGAVFRSVGYTGVPLEGVPFDAKAGVIANRDGRVVDGDALLPGQYAVGWCRRGATGVVGTNKSDATAVVERIVEDVERAGVVAARPRPARAAIDDLLASRDVHVVTFADWAALDAVEIATGRDRGKIREKLPSVDAMMSHLLRRARGAA